MLNPSTSKRKRQISADEAREILEAAPRIIVQDDPHNNVYPMPVDTADTDDIYVGRIRHPGTVTDIMGIVIGAVVVLIQLKEKKQGTVGV